MTIKKNAASMAAQAEPCLIRALDSVDDLRGAHSALNALTQLMASCGSTGRDCLPVAAQDLAELMNVVHAEVVRCTDALRASIEAARAAQKGGAA